MSNVSGIIKSIQDIMRKDVGVDGDAQRISQLVWMFFLKIFDDREDELELLEDDYNSPLPEHLRWRTWAADPEGMTGDALADFVNIQLFPTLKQSSSLTARRQTGARGPQRLRRRLQLHEVRHADAPGHQQDQRDRLQQHQRPPHLRQHLRTNPEGPAKRRQRGRVLHPARRHPVHRQPRRSAAGRNRARPGLRHRRLSDLHHRAQAQATTSKPEQTKRPCRPPSTAWRRKPCRTCSASPT